MKKLSRRSFLGKSALGIGSALLASQMPIDLRAATGNKTVSMPIGFQSWIVRDKIGKDFPGTMKMVAGMGYQSVEMCSPQGYQGLGFGSLVKFSGGEIKQIINDAGLQLLSTHYGMDELRKNLDDRIKWATDSGQKQMIVSTVGLPGKATLSDWMKAADELNNMGDAANKAGLEFGYHNHHTEFQVLEGKLIYDELMNRLDKDKVKMQFQVAVISVGYKASDYFIKYPGRFISAHLADWSKEKKTQVPIGQGVVDWKEFFANIKTGGVKNIFVEMDIETFKDSFNYLNNL